MNKGFSIYSYYGIFENSNVIYLDAYELRKDSLRNLSIKFHWNMLIGCHTYSGNIIIKKT